MSNIFELTTELKNIYEMLESGEYIDSEGNVNEEVERALILTQNNLQTKAIDYGYVIKNLDNEIEVYDKEIKRLQERKRVMQNTQEKLKDILSKTMQQFGITEIKGNTIKLTFKKSEAVEILDLEQIPNEYKKVKMSVEADKNAIKNAIKIDGEIIDGARIVERYNLQIK